MKRLLLLIVMQTVWHILYGQQFELIPQNLSKCLQTPSGRWGIVTNNHSGDEVIGHIYDSQLAGRDYLTYAATGNLTDKLEMEWVVTLRYGCLPSSSNGWSLVLASDGDASSLAGQNVGRSLQLGVNLSGSDDLVKVWEQVVAPNGSKSTKTICATSLNWETSIGTSCYCTLKITKSRAGVWRVFYQKEGMPDFVVVGDFSYTGQVSVRSFGISYWYTQSADRNLWLKNACLKIEQAKKVEQDVRVSGIRLADTTVKSSSSSNTAVAAIAMVRDEGKMDTLPTLVKQLGFKVNTNFKVDEVWLKRALKASFFMSASLSFSKADSLLLVTFNEADTVLSGRTKEYQLAVNVGDTLPDHSLLSLKLASCQLLLVNEDPALVNALVSESYSRRIMFDVVANGFFAAKELNFVKRGSMFAPSFAAIGGGGRTDADFNGECELYAELGSRDTLHLKSKARNGVVSFDSLRAIGAGRVRLVVSSEGMLPYEKIIRAINDTTSSIISTKVDTVDVDVGCSSLETSVRVACFDLIDKGGDSCGTTLNKLYLGFDASKVDPQKLIAGVCFYSGDKLLKSRIKEISREAMVVEVPDSMLAVKDGCSARFELSLFVYPNELIDNAIVAISFRGAEADSSGSLLSLYGGTVGLGTFCLKVIADTLAVTKIPSLARPKAGFDVWVKAVDNYGNVDVDFAKQCKLTFQNNSGYSRIGGFLQGVAKFVGCQLSRSGVDTLEAFSDGLWTKKQLLVADNDSYFKPFSSTAELPPILSRSSYLPLLKFELIDAGLCDTLSTSVAQLEVLCSDVEGRPLAFSLLDSVAIFFNGRKLGASCDVKQGGRIAIKLKVGDLAVSNGCTGAIEVWAKLSRLSAGCPFVVSIPTDGVLVQLSSSQLARQCSYPIRSDTILYLPKPSKILKRLHPLLLALGDHALFELVLATEEGVPITLDRSALNVRGLGVEVISNQNVKGIHSVGIKVVGGANLQLGVALGDSIRRELGMFGCNRMDSILNLSSMVDIGNSWRKTSDGLVHSGESGSAILCHKMIENLYSKKVQWHYQLKLGHKSMSSENYVRFILLADRMPNMDSSYRAVWVTFRKVRDKFAVFLESVVNGRVIQSASDFIDDDYAGKRVDLVVAKDHQGSWLLNLYVDGSVAAELGCTGITLAPEMKTVGVEYACTESYVGKLSIHKFDVVASNSYFKLISGFCTTKGEVNVVANQELGECALAISDANGLVVNPTDKKLGSNGLRFRVPFPLSGKYKITMVNAEGQADSVWAFLKGGLEYGDVTVSEIMYNPKGAVGLPEVDYVEVYNCTVDSVCTGGWSMVVSGKVYRLASRVIPPKGFAIISGLSGCMLLSEKGLAIMADGFSGLPNTNGDITLLNSNGALITSSHYSGFLNDGSEHKAGVSLEKLDVSSLEEGKVAWVACSDRCGGTPGVKNSVEQRLDKSKSPLVEDVVIRGLNVVDIQLDEPTAPSTLAKASLDGVDVGIQIEQNNASPRRIVAKLAADISSDKVQLLRFTGVCDYDGNELSSSIKLAVCRPAKRGDVIINEVLFNPKGQCSDFVELYNNSDYPQNLGGLRLARRDTQGAVSEFKLVSESLDILEPSNYALLCTTPEAILLEYPCASSSVFRRMASMPSYPNSAGVVVLADTAGNVVDEMSYSENMHFRMLPEVAGVSLERVRFSDNVWVSASRGTGYATPGMPNSQAVTIDKESQGWSLSSDVFSPNSDGINDFLSISYPPDCMGAMVDADIYTSSGVVVKKLCRNENLGASGTIVWDGITDGGNLAGRGVYLLVIRVVFPDGATLQKRLVFAVAYR